MNILVSICARGGSKGIPGKNIKPLLGRPLISYTISLAKVFAEQNDGIIALSTDSADIKRVAEENKLNTSYVRPDFLSSDSAGKVDTIKDILQFQEKELGIKFDYVLDLDVTSPLRTLEDLNAAFDLFKSNSEALTLFSVNEAGRNPYFNMVEEKQNGFYGIIKKLDSPALSRQSAPPVYDLNASFYFYRREFFDTGMLSPITNRSLIYKMSHMCFDLDHSIDFTFMEYLMSNNKLDFDFS